MAILFALKFSSNVLTSYFTLFNAEGVMVEKDFMANVEELLVKEKEEQQREIEKSKETISAAVIGLVIIMAAYALTQFIFDQLSARGGGGTVTTQTSSTDTNTLLCETISDKAQCVAEGCAYLDPSGSTPGRCLTP
jgi:hypothetical protein